MKLVEYLVRGLEEGYIAPTDLNGLYEPFRITILERYCKRLTERKLMEVDTAV